jgi:hypothetical protein
MNNPFVIRQADGFAGQLMEDGADDAERIQLAYERCYTRPPSEREVSAALRFLDEYGRSRARRAAWIALCQAMFAGAEFGQR